MADEDCGVSPGHLWCSTLLVHLAFRPTYLADLGLHLGLIVPKLCPTSAEMLRVQQGQKVPLGQLADGIDADLGVKQLQFCEPFVTPIFSGRYWEFGQR